ncbi:propionyl-CoA synthetase [Denitrobaculum tricleocarpae]|uniref:Propionyl-CoA synthetase n=1 Tax=Denitrobaculum tricleocarpae TaxID=2591009 RepID=A0A545TMY5_9PROT|nr:propionyl-CoA synthetase [Denitrobaculum tricleocarpae]TQV78574.1 propionyl-CoA synthetase [Denitrobaculum tricleocarpae]
MAKSEFRSDFSFNTTGRTRPQKNSREQVALVHQKIGPVAAFKTVIPIQHLPKTRSVKILQGTMQKIASVEDWKMVAAIDDPNVLDQTGSVLKARQGPGRFG